MSEIISRDEAEELIKEAIDSYQPEGILQQILDLTHGDGEFLVVDKLETEEDEDA